MLIRSQDKKQLLNLDTISNIEVFGGATAHKIKSINSNGFLDYIAEYSTEAKAIKVLDMIQGAYARFCAGNTYSDSVFQMPQESEV